MPTGPRDRYAVLRTLGQVREATVAAISLVLSPESQLLAWMDWALHLAGAPDKRLELWLRLLHAQRLFARGVLHRTPPAPPTPLARLQPDHRFEAESWQQEPFRSWAHSFLLTERWWYHATHAVPGTEPHHADRVGFVALQCLDLLAPSNQILSNPEVLTHSLQCGGRNLLRGAMHCMQDTLRKLGGLAPVGSEAFVIGRDLACTPGKVVMRNALVELIQYSPSTASVHAEPLLLVPAWIMKYYILDLSPHNSLVRWLVAHGHTVFCLSWRNVGAAQRNFGLEDYRRLGVMQALEAIGHIVGHTPIHALGYCLGGTLLANAAAAMARAGDTRLASVTLLAAQTDFTEPGELQLFIDAAQVHMLDSVMALRGYLPAEQMRMSFQMLRSNDLIWSRMVREYMLGERAPMNDLMAWNADSTRMPQRMHSEYLHQLFLHNDLAAGRYLVEGHPVALQNIRVPLFVVGTESDHVSPWRSVYKIHYLTDTALCFVLTSGGHNAGIVSAPGHAKRHYRMRLKPADGVCLSANEWLASTPEHQGSWWPAWQRWLCRHSSPSCEKDLGTGQGPAARSGARARRVPPPPMGGGPYTPLMDAPGSYVRVRA